jgi:hypothetical protein
MRKSNTKCEVCGKVFYKRPSQQQITNHDYCSRECYKIGITTDKHKICEVCGESFEYHKPSQRFCSIKCVASRPREIKWNGAGKHRARTIQSRLKDEGWDGNCMIEGCGYNLTLDVHRVVPGYSGGTYTTNNTAVICSNHHQEIHRLGKIIEKKSKFIYTLK